MNNIYTYKKFKNSFKIYDEETCEWLALPRVYCFKIQSFNWTCSPSHPSYKVLNTLNCKVTQHKEHNVTQHNITQCNTQNNATQCNTTQYKKIHYKFSWAYHCAQNVHCFSSNCTGLLMLELKNLSIFYVMLNIP